MPSSTPSQASSAPSAVPDDLGATVDFLLEIDKLKRVERRNRLTDGSRRENTAEHSWHLGIAVAALAPFAPQPIDVARAMTMALVHDIVEIDAGDTFAYDEHLAETKASLEHAAADRLYSLLPPTMGAYLRGLWDEYEAGETDEAKFVMAIDRMTPMLINTAEGGTAWREAGITRARVEARNRRFVEAGLPSLWPLLADRLDRSVQLGHIEPGAATGQ